MCPRDFSLLLFPCLLFFVLDQCLDLLSLWEDSKSLSFLLPFLGALSMLADLDLWRLFCLSCFPLLCSCLTEWSLGFLSDLLFVLDLSGSLVSDSLLLRAPCASWRLSVPHLLYSLPSGGLLPSSLGCFLPKWWDSSDLRFSCLGCAS